MKRVIAILLLAALGVFSYLSLQGRPPEIVVTNAKAFGPPGSSMFMVTATLENMGAPDRLLEVRSSGADMIAVMNSDFPGVELTVPGQSKSEFAMDGAHLMMRVADGAFEQGAFVPLTLVFADAGEVLTRIEHVGDAPMLHDMTNGVTSDVPPRFVLLPVTSPKAVGFDVSLEVENFEFVRTANDAPHVAGQGHAHVYLNGLKLGRLYVPNFQVGALASGEYVLRVALNSNDHRPYFDDGGPISRSVSFSIP